MLLEIFAELGSLEKAVFLRSFVSLASPSELLPILCAAQELVGVVMSMGSPACGEGADVFMVGVGVGVGVVVMMGIVRTPRPSSWSRPDALLGTCSVTVAIGSTIMQVISMMGRGAVCRETQNKGRREEGFGQKRDAAQHGARGKNAEEEAETQTRTQAQEHANSDKRQATSRPRR